MLTQISIACFVLWLCHSYNLSAQSKGIMCLNCNDVSSPKHCQDITICGEDEICHTREFIDHIGVTGFHLGCQDIQTCQLAQSRNILIGKRDITDVNPAPRDKCNECCSTDVCNNKLCLGSGGTTATPSSLPTATIQGCPEKYVSFADNCYLFDTEVRNWTEARRYCKGLLADLPSIHSRAENDFIAKTLTDINAYTNVEYWTSGVYSHTGKEWVWLDGTPFIYTHWYPRYPPSTYNRSLDYYLLLMNPANFYSFKGAPWDYTTFIDIRYVKRGVICKKHL